MNPYYLAACAATDRQSDNKRERYFANINRESGGKASGATYRSHGTARLMRDERFKFDCFLSTTPAVVAPRESYENALIAKRIFLTPYAKSSVLDVHEG